MIFVAMNPYPGGGEGDLESRDAGLLKPKSYGDERRRGYPNQPDQPKEKEEKKRMDEG